MRGGARADSLMARSMEPTRVRIRMFHMGPVTWQDETRWRAALGRLGMEGVRTRLAQLTSLDHSEMVEIDGVMPSPPRRFVETWLRRQEQKKRRFWVMAFLAFLAAIVAAISVIGRW